MLNETFMLNEIKNEFYFIRINNLMIINHVNEYE